MSERENENQGGSGVATLSRPRVKRPSLYKVLMLNDDYTTMDFVIHVLQKFFQKSYDEANQIMLNVHNKGKGLCGLYPQDIAATKVMQVNDYARSNEMPLKCAMEKE